MAWASVAAGLAACSVVNAPEAPPETGTTTPSGGSAAQGGAAGSGGTTTTGTTTTGTTTGGTGGSGGTGGAPPNCVDGTQNGDETDLDCGGSCAPCANGEGCLVAADCQSEICSADVCEPFDCGDSLQNGSESDVDCGGADCPQCQVGEQCNQPSDCVTDTCDNGTCAAPPCNPTWLTKSTSWTQNNLTYASELCCSYLATSLLDNSITTRWVASSTTNQWVIFNFGAPATLSGFEILNQANHTPNSGVRDMTIQVAANLNGPWTDVTSFTVANQQNTFQQFFFQDTTSQYWRAFGHNNWGYQSYIQYMEVGFYGCL